jgi:hypothetical protein
MSAPTTYASPGATAAPARTLIAALAGAGVAWGSLSYVALTIGVLAQGYGLSLRAAASLASLELGAMALATMSGGYALRIVSIRRLAILGGSVAGAANLAAAFAADGLVMSVTRAAAGLGLGWMTAALNTSLSRSADPQRLFIRANFGCITIAAAFFYVMPMIYERSSFPMYFIAYGGLCLAAAGFVAWLPPTRIEESGARAAGRPRGGAKLGVFLAVSVVWLCYSAVWSLVERFGSDIGMSEESIGVSMGLGTLSGLLGAGVAAWLAGRIRPLAPLVLTSLSSGLCYLWIAFCRGSVEYTWILCIWGVVFCPILAYAFAVATDIDPSGSLGRMISGGTAITTALGPVAGARLQEMFGFRGVGVATLAGTAAACLVILLVAARGPRRLSAARS